MMRKIEIEFPVDIEMPDMLAEERGELITYYICEPYKKEHPDRVMWVSGHGAKMVCSRIDAAMLGKQEYDESIPDGDEPNFDESVYEISITERENYK